MNIEKFAIGATYATVNTDMLLSSEIRVYTLDIITTGIDLYLPDARWIRTVGGPIFILENIGSQPANIRTRSGIILTTLPADHLGWVDLRDNSTIDGPWIIRVVPSEGYGAPAMLMFGGEGGNGGAAATFSPVGTEPGAQDPMLI